jgi:hypothetical protein
MGFYKSDDYVDPLSQLLPCRLQHRVSLTYTRGGPEKDLELPLAAPLSLLAYAIQDQIRIRPAFFHFQSSWLSVFSHF